MSVKELQLQQAYVDRVYQEIKRECRKYGFMCECKFGMIFIRNMYEEFYFEPVYQGKVRLMHRPCNLWKGSTEYHEQFRKYISPKNVVKYIDQHLKWKLFDMNRVIRN